MEQSAEELLGMLDHVQLSHAWATRSKVTYERHMAAWQQFTVAESKRLALKSAKEARRAPDEVGALFAETNIGGLILPAEGHWQDGLKLLAETAAKAEFIRDNGLVADVERANRVLMNCDVFTIQNSIKFGCPYPYAIEALLKRLEKNPVFEKYKEKEWAVKLFQEANAYIKFYTDT